MKLAGSLTEGKIRERLISSAVCIFSDNLIFRFLEAKLGFLSSVYVLNHTPGQGEEYYAVLINGSVVANFELSRNRHAASVETIENFVFYDVREYRSVIRGRPAHLKLAIALELAKNAR